MGYAPQILVVESEPAVEFSFERALSDVGYYVTVVRKARLALAQLRSREFTAVIVDLSPSDREREDLVRQIRSEFPRIPVLALSEPTAAGIDRQMNAAGATDALVKPVAIEALLLKIYRLIEPRGTWESR